MQATPQRPPRAEDASTARCLIPPDKNTRTEERQPFRRLAGLPNEEQGLATGLTSMTQQIALTVGIPLLSSIAATQTIQLAGIHLALGANVTVTLGSVVLIWLGLRKRQISHRHLCAEAMNHSQPGAVVAVTSSPAPAGFLRPSSTRDVYPCWFPRS
ncbi:hypothetical protein ABIB56_001268 [Glaciihabitans sp. UYNi722]